MSLRCRPHPPVPIVGFIRDPRPNLVCPPLPRFSGWFRPSSGYTALRSCGAMPCPKNPDLSSPRMPQSCGIQLERPRTGTKRGRCLVVWVFLGSRLAQFACVLACTTSWTVGRCQQSHQLCGLVHAVCVFLKVDALIAGRFPPLVGKPNAWRCRCVCCAQYTSPPGGALSAKRDVSNVALLEGLLVTFDKRVEQLSGSNYHPTLGWRATHQQTRLPMRLGLPTLFIPDNSVASNAASKERNPPKKRKVELEPSLHQTG